MSTLASSELGELAFRIMEAGGPNSWILVVSERDGVSLADALLEEIQALGGDGAVTASVASPEDLRRAARQNPDGILVVHGVSAFADESWRSVDANRTQYLRSGTTVLVLPEMCAGKLEALAPNLASWIGGSVLGLRDEPAPLDPEAVESRLSELRAWSGLDDAEVLRQAEHGTLPLDPLYSEWMVLLRRGDLLVS